MALAVKFNAGDTVRIKCTDRRFYGRMGRVESVNVSTHAICVYVKIGGQSLGFATGELEIVTD